MELRMNCFQAQHLREQVALHESLEAVRSALSSREDVDADIAELVWLG